MYLMAGPNFQFEAAGRGDGVKIKQGLELKNFNTTFDVGMGFDIFFQLFKFTPEIRYSFGFRNLLPDEPNDFDAALSKLTTHNVTAFITFEGGPTYLKRGKGKYQLSRKKEGLILVITGKFGNLPLKTIF